MRNTYNFINRLAKGDIPECIVDILCEISALIIMFSKVPANERLDLVTKRFMA